MMASAEWIPPKGIDPGDVLRQAVEDRTARRGRAVGLTRAARPVCKDQTISVVIDEPLRATAINNANAFSVKVLITWVLRGGDGVERFRLSLGQLGAGRNFVTI